MKTRSNDCGAASGLANLWRRNNCGSRGRSPHRYCIILLTILVATLARAATNDLTSALQNGLFEEEANHNLEAAAQAYQAVSAQFDKDRKLAATAIFRLGEVYRKQNKTNEAVAQYERIVREFSDQQTLATLSRQNLGGLGKSSAPTSAGNFSERVNQIIQRAAKPPSLTTTTDDEEKEIQRIKAMIQNSPDLINSPNSGGGTPLQLAAERGQLIVARYLLDNKADVNRTSNGETPLTVAAIQGHKAMVELLLSWGADVNAVGGGGSTALHQAAQRGYLAVAEALLANKADLSARNSDANGQAMPLHLAAGAGNSAVAGLLIARGADVNAVDRRGQTPLLHAAMAGHSAMVKALLAAKADPNLQTESGRTALGVAAERGYLEVVKALIVGKADPNRAAASPPIFGSLKNPIIMELLLNSGAKPNVTNAAGDTPLIAAIYEGSELGAKLLLERGADVNAKNARRMTPLQMAIWAEKISIVSMLLTNGADVNAEGPAGRNAMLMVKEAMGGFRPYNPGEYGGNGRAPDRAIAERMAALLREHGAVEELPFFDRIEVRRSATSFSSSAFRLGTNGWNEFSLLEALAQHYGFITTTRNATWERDQTVMASSFWGMTTKCQFPDFAQLTIRRAGESRFDRKDIVVDALALLESGTDVKLQPGDIIDIPELDHPINESWNGIADLPLSNLLHYVSRAVTISVKGSNTVMQLAPSFYRTGFGTSPARRFSRGSFMVKSVLVESRLLRASSDVTRVKVMRTWDGKTREWILDCSAGNDPDLWLRDGDVIEVPDKP